MQYLIQMQCAFSTVHLLQSIFYSVVRPHWLCSSWACAVSALMAWHCNHCVIYLYLLYLFYFVLSHGCMIVSYFILYTFYFIIAYLRFHGLLLQVNFPCMGWTKVLILTYLTSASMSLHLSWHVVCVWCVYCSSAC